ncbi:MAG: prepilin-type N-terminal cleavage/methylation domain-containing protein [Candidatus Staskawiczbacteria bacterium]|nr:prepilin-type N-terminal cleavage/methylation domain-containing protein [Candidatus Staskawiczbacteria bacterium]
MHTNYTNKKIKESGGFTLVEMLVVVAVIVILTSVVLYSSTQYIDKGKDATVKGNLVVLITAGEVWYDKNNSSYAGFCGSDVAMKALSQVPAADDLEDKHCKVNDTATAWAACAREFVDNTKAYCVDNKGNQKEINNTDCTSGITNCCFAGIANCIP